MQALLQPEASIQARDLLNLSQARVAKDTGINRAYLSQFENGKRILKDAENDALYNYYDEQGLDVAELKQPQQPEALPSQPELKPVYSVNPLRIKDGMVITRDLDSETVEMLMVEYYDLQQQIEQTLKQPVKRGVIFGGIDHETTFNRVLPVLLQCYRLYQLKLILQGQEAIVGNEPLPENEIETLNQFLLLNFSEL